MSEQTRQALENAIAAHMQDEKGDETVVLSEWVLFTSAEYLVGNPGITSYSWWCTYGMTHSHLLGLIELGTRGVNSHLEGTTDES